MGRRCCCVTGCLIGDDDFNRADAETLGPKWMTAISGTWHIVSGEAVEQTGSGQILFAKRHPIPDPSGVAYLDAVDPLEDDVYELLVNAEEDGDNFHLARFTVEAEEVKIELFRVAGGVETLLETGYSAGWLGTRFRMIAIISRTQFCAYIDDVLSLVWYAMPDLFSEGYYAGMGASGREDIAVDDWEFYQHLETYTGCPYCICHCEETPMPPTLLATVTDATGRMSSIDLCELPLDWNREISTWEQRSGTDCGCTDLGLELICSEQGDISGMLLTVARCHDTAKGAAHFWAPIEEDSTCDPLYLKYGPMVVTAGDFVCVCGGMENGEYYIVITEP